MSYKRAVNQEREAILDQLVADAQEQYCEFLHGMGKRVLALIWNRLKAALVQFAGIVEELGDEES